MSSPDPVTVNWVLTGVAGALTLGRFGIRGHKSRRLYSDDLAHLLAFLVLVTHGATSQLSLGSKANLSQVTKGSKGSTISQDDLFQLYQHNRALNTVNNCCLYLVFWLVKISFLLFYYQLFHISVPFRKAWWAVMAFTLATFWIPIGGVLNTCTNMHSNMDYKECNAGGPARATKLEYSCAFNVATDLAIMALPLWMLKDLKIQISQKLGLAFIFSFAFVCIAFDILRTVQAVAQNQALYTILEINFVVIISCLPTYRALLNPGQPHKSSRSSRMYSWKESGKNAWLRSKDGDGRALRGDVEKGTETSKTGIQVTKDFAVSKVERDPYALDSSEYGSDEFRQPETAHGQPAGVSMQYSNAV